MAQVFMRRLFELISQDLVLAWFKSGCSERFIYEPRMPDFILALCLSNK